MDSSGLPTPVLPPLTWAECGPTGPDLNVYNRKYWSPEMALKRMNPLNGDPSGPYQQLPAAVPRHEVQMGMSSLNGEPSGSYQQLPSVVPRHEIRMGKDESIFRPGNAWEPIKYEAAVTHQPIMPPVSAAGPVTHQPMMPPVSAAGPVTHQPMMPPISAAGPVNGDTPVCGVYSPEINEPKPKAKDANSLNFKYECPRCHSKFSRKYTVKQHFPSCIYKYGNPDSLKWNDHDSTRNYKSRKEYSHNRFRKQVTKNKHNALANTTPVPGQQDK